MPMSGIISADMTKLIAADSFVSCLGSDQSHSLLRGPTDPDAAQSFEDLCDVLTNDTLIYFKRPDVFPPKPRPIMAVWSKVAGHLIDTGKVASPPPPRNQPVLSLTERCQIMVDPFVTYVKSEDASAKLSRWVRFQSSDPELMAIFWTNNTEEELQVALDIMLQHCRAIPVTLRKALAGPPFEIDSVSRLYLKERAWASEEYGAAYIFWAFVKGYRYAASLTDQHVYAFHWLRRRAMNVDMRFNALADEYLDRLFPWGHFLSGLIRDPEFKYDRDSVAAAIEELRKYTKGNLGSATDAKRLREFTRQGLEQCVPKELGAADYFGKMTKMVDWLLVLSAVFGPGGLYPVVKGQVAMALGVVKCFGLAVPASGKDRVNLTCKRLRLWSRRSTIASLIRRHRPLLLEYLKHYK